MAFVTPEMPAEKAAIPPPKTKTKARIDYPTLGSIERNDPAVDLLIPADAKIEKLAEGFTWSEGPVWVKRGGYLLFRCSPKYRLKWEEGRMAALEFLKPSGYTGSRAARWRTWIERLVAGFIGPLAPVPTRRSTRCPFGERRPIYPSG